MGNMERAVLRLNLEYSLRLWLEAIAAGEYDTARRLMDWRVTTKAALEAN